MEYEDFTIRFESKGGKRFKVKVESVAGDDSTEIELTRTLDELLAMIQSLGQVVRSSASGQPQSEGEKSTREAGIVQDVAIQPTELGKELYRDLFVGAAGSKFDQALGNTKGRNVGLRIKIHVDPNDSQIAHLGSLPWELLCHPDMGDQPLSLSSDTPIVRHLDSPRPLNLVPFKSPLRILVVVSSPRGVAYLDLDKEKQSIRNNWAEQKNVEVKFLERATIESLGNELANHDYHVLHYMGHGDFDEDRGVGVLLMETASGEQDAVDGRSLGVVLQNSRSLRLVLVNACNTAKLNNIKGKDPYAGIATSLVLAGIPAVIAMQFPISDGAAITFSKCLYNRLAKGYALDHAVTEGRKAVRLADRASLEWAIPVLFMRTKDGNLFELESPAVEHDGSPPEHQQVKESDGNHDTVSPVKSNRLGWSLAGLAVIALTVGFFAWLRPPTPVGIIVSGTVTDPTSDSLLSGANVRVQGSGKILGTTNSKGDFQISIPAEHIHNKESVNLEFRRNGYLTENKNVSLSAHERLDDVKLIPDQLEICLGRKQKHLVMVGKFDAPHGRDDLPDLSRIFQRSLEDQLLVELQKDHLEPEVQPGFDLCPEASPKNTDHSSFFAKTLGVDVFLSGYVTGTGPYIVKTSVGDQFDLFDGANRSNTAETTNVTDPTLAQLDKATQANILLALARGYQEQGQFDDCVTVSRVAERLAEGNKEAIQKQLQACVDQVPNRGLL